MELISLELNNIGSHEDTFIDFTNIGVAAIIGSNGSGKSTIFDGIKWIIFGSYSENEDYLRHGEKKGFGKIRFREDKSLYLIKRTLHKVNGKVKSKLILKVKDGEVWNKLTDEGIGSKRDIQKKIIEIIHANEDIFLNTAYIKQGEIGSFMKLNTNDRREVFSKPEGLPIYKIALKIAKERLKKYKLSFEVIKQRVIDFKSSFKEKYDSGRSIKDLQDKLNDYQSNLSNLKFKIEKIEKNKEKLSESESAKKQIDILKEAIDDAKNRIESIQNKNSDILNNYKKYEEEFDKINERIDEYEDNETISSKTQLEISLSKINDSIKIYKSSILEKEEQADNIKKKCDKCGNILTDEQFSKMKKDLNKEIKNLNDILEESYSNKQNIKDDIAAYDKKFEKINTLKDRKKELEEIKIEYSNIWNKLDEAKINHKKIKNDNEQKISELSSSIIKDDKDLDNYAELKEEYDSISQKLGGIKSKIKDLKLVNEKKKEDIKEFKVLINEKLKAERKLKIYSYTVSMFAGIPTTIIKEAVPEIEQEANEILTKFSLNLILKIVTEDENGKEVFDWIIKNNEQDLKYHRLSGGERLRVNFAFRIGNSIRCSHICGCKLDFLLVDEIHDLDKEGIQEFVEIINELSKMYKLILVISHDESIKDAFSTQFIVRKKGKDSSVKILKNGEKI